MRRLFFIAFCLLTGSLHSSLHSSLHAQMSIEPVVTAKCGCDLVTWKHQYLGQNEWLTDDDDSLFFDYTENTVTDEKGHTHTLAYGEVLTDRQTLYFDGKKIVLFYDHLNLYRGHVLTRLPARILRGQKNSR